jgi:hypothetical protein
LKEAKKNTNHTLKAQNTHEKGLAFSLSASLQNKMQNK